jgi:hypothetical protein
MGIGPFDFGERSLKPDRFIPVELGREGMMSERRMYGRKAQAEREAG